MTLRRPEDAGLSPFLALLYFVPVVNYLLMLPLCCAAFAPSRAEVQRPPEAGAGRAGRAAGALVGWASERSSRSPGAGECAGLRVLRDHLFVATRS